jgi:hypothetical protein
MRILLVLVLTLWVGIITAQNTNAYQFIEPNVSLKYDSSFLKPSSRYSNPVYGTETYGFSCSIPNRIKATAQISTGLPAKNADQRYQDSVSNALIKQINRYAGDSITVKATRPIRYKGFQGYAFITLRKKSKEFDISFACTKFFDDGLCKIYYISTSKTAINGFDKDSTIVTNLIDGIDAYSKKDFEQEAGLLKQKYTIVVDSIGRPSGFPSIEATYFGMVKVKEKLENTILSIDMGYQQFFPDYKNEIIVYFKDAEKGRIEKKGELIMLNKAGKQVRLPFTFAYYNK